MRPAAIVSYLDEKGIRDNTLIVYVGDNGWIQHPERNGYDARSKQTPYEAAFASQPYILGPLS